MSTSQKKEGKFTGRDISISTVAAANKVDNSTLDITPEPHTQIIYLELTPSLAKDLHDILTDKENKPLHFHTVKGKTGNYHESISLIIKKLEQII